MSYICILVASKPSMSQEMLSAHFAMRPPGHFLLGEFLGNDPDFFPLLACNQMFIQAEDANINIPVNQFNQ